ncbi:MAG TPA: amidohydrolase, partial [Solirubrobacteraceae bacterium]
MLLALLEALERELPAALELRRELHAQPELAHAEHQTAARVAAALPVPATTVAGTGLAALIAGGPGAPVALRAELDALPIRERTGASFSASGEAMHACGHDVHMAALVALTRAAHSLTEALPAPLLAIFQPSEEAYPSGAEELARGALADFAPRAIVAAHIHPELAWGSVGLDPGIVNASCDAIEIVIEGTPTHGAYPHLGRDPVLALAEVVVALHAQLARRINPLNPVVLTIGQLQAGSAENVIPARATARGALRAYRVEDRRALAELTAEVVSGVAGATG